MRNARGAVCTGDRTVDEMSNARCFGGIRQGNALSDFFLGPLFIGCAHRINSVGAAYSVHQRSMVSEVTDSDFNPLLTQSASPDSHRPRRT